MDEKQSKEAREQMEIKLGKPAMLEFSETIRKMRMHLLLCSVIGIGVTIMNIHISPNSPVFGLQLTGLTESKFLLGLLLINGYMLAHFAWGAWDYAIEWWLRLGGVNTNMDSPFFGGEGQNDPKHSTLHNFWVMRSGALINTERVVEQLKGLLEQYVEVNGNLQKDENERLRNMAGPSNVTLALNTVSASIDAAKAIAVDPQLAMSIERFDKWFTHFRRSQGIRWALLELGLPIALGLYSVCKLFSAWQHAPTCPSCLFS